MAIVTLCVVIEALVVSSYGAYLLVETVVAVATERVAAAVLGVFVLGLGVVLGLLARGVWRGIGRVRTPLLLWQVLQVAVAWPALSGPRWPLGAALILLAVVVAVGVLRRDVLGSIDPGV